MSALSNSNPSLNSRPSSMNLSSQNKEELIMQLNELHTELGVLVKIYSEDKVKLKNAIENHDNYKGNYFLIDLKRFLKIFFQRVNSWWFRSWWSEYGPSGKFEANFEPSQSTKCPFKGKVAKNPFGFANR